MDHRVYEFLSFEFKASKNVIKRASKRFGSMEQLLNKCISGFQISIQ